MSFKLVYDGREQPVVIHWSTATHAASHWDDNAIAAMDRMVVVCSDPDFITLNVSNYRLQRTGNEAYYRHFPDMGKFVMVPVRSTNETYHVGGEAVANVRFATTCYVKDEAPAVRRIWTRKI